jgi:hypothetical protein
MTPREKFRQNRALTRGYNETIGGDQMQAALDAASLELDNSFGITSDINSAAADRWRREGANMLRIILENLNASAASPTRSTAGQLDHHV